VPAQEQPGDGALAQPPPSAAFASGSYVARTPLGPVPLRTREDLRLDVDGRYPQMAASGTIVGPLQPGVHWIANLRRTGPNGYAGSIWFRDGNPTLLPHTDVVIIVVRSPFPNQRRATIVFSSGGATGRTRTYDFVSDTFHPVELEYDTVQGSTGVTSIGTDDHRTDRPRCPLSS
jgi:hypothetical protein